MDETQICPCEHVAHGELGKVADEERIARVVVSPNHFKKDKTTLKPSVFPQSHIRESGLSLLRVDKMSTESIELISNAIAGTMDNQKVSGFALFSTGRVRKLKDDAGRRMLCVADDPIEADDNMPANPAHAIAISAFERNDDEILEIQSELYELINGTVLTLPSIHPED